MVNAADAVDCPADHLDGPVVLLSSSQGGILAITVAARNRRLALVAAHNLLDPSLPESLMISRLPGWLVGGYRPLLASPRLAARIAPELPGAVVGRADLAAGAPFENVGAVVDPGAVSVVYGSAAGLSPTGSQTFWQGTGGAAGAAERLDLFGFALAVENFGGGGAADLAIGSPLKDVGAAPDAGADSHPRRRRTASRTPRPDRQPGSCCPYARPDLHPAQRSGERVRNYLE